MNSFTLLGCFSQLVIGGAEVSKSTDPNLNQSSTKIQMESFVMWTSCHSKQSAVKHIHVQTDLLAHPLISERSLWEKF